MYPYLLELFKLDTIIKKFVFTVFLIISFTYAILVFLGKDISMDCLDNAWGLKDISFLIKGSVLILFNLCLAKILEKINFLSDIGKDTLYLCGNEYIIKELVPWFLAKLGIIINFENLYFVLFYNFLLIVLSLKTLNILEKSFFDFLFNKFFTFNKQKRDVKLSL